MEAGRNVTFAGFMGAGKSEIAERVANLLVTDLAEMDAIIEESEGCTIAEMIDRHGEQNFRRVESRVLRELLNWKGMVIASGGGALVNQFYGDSNCEVAREKSTVVWLKVDFETAAGRVKTDQKGRKRPLFNENVRALFDARQPLYENAAHIIIDANSPVIEEVVAGVMEALEAYWNS